MSFFRELAEYKDFDFWQFWEQVKISEVKTVLSKKKLMKNDLNLLSEFAESPPMFFAIPNNSSMSIFIKMLVVLS